jgi:hypothetical protein
MVRKDQNPRDTGIGRGKAGSPTFDIFAGISTGPITSQ